MDRAQITVDFPANALGNPVIHRVLGTGRFFSGVPASVLVQTDYDYAGVASTFGWVPCQDCTETDGTVACAHRDVSEMLSEALQYLEDHDGDEVEDPGYFC